MNASEDTTAVPVAAGTVPQPSTPEPPAPEPVEPLAELPAPSGWRSIGQWLAEVACAVLLVIACAVVFSGWDDQPVDYVQLAPIMLSAGVFAGWVCRPSWSGERVLLTSHGIVGAASWTRIAWLEVHWGWHGGRMVRLVLQDGTRVPVSMVGSGLWRDKPFATNLARLIEVARAHNPTIPVRHRMLPLLMAGLVLVPMTAVAGIHLRQRGVISPWTPVASGPVPACGALERDGGRRWPGNVRTARHSSAGADLTSCTWQFDDAVADWTHFGQVRMDIVTHPWRPTRSPIAAAMYRYDHDREAMLIPQPLPGVGDEASMVTHTDFIEVIARRANLTLVLRLYYIGDVWPARDAAAAIAAETLQGVRLSGVLL